MEQNVIRRGRLGTLDERAAQFISSMTTDEWLFRYDILVDIAHVAMLRRQSIINQTTYDALATALILIRERGYARLPQNVDDVHVAIETALTKEVGAELGGWLHVGRSRNDEVATCIRMAFRAELASLMHEILELQDAVLREARKNDTTIMPGFTHLQHAQPTTLGHHLLAYHDALERDFQRLLDCYDRTNQSPLGAAAFASTGFPLDRDFTASALGFAGVVEHSMDAVSARDFVIEGLAAISNLMVTLSRLAEELILWSTTEFGYVELDDRFTSTSSIMPQKKNPDTLELIRAKTGSVIAALVAGLAILKALPYSYNLDLQEITPHLRQAAATAIDSVRIATGVLGTLEVNKDRLADMSAWGFTAATELADTIVRTTHVPFRTAHTIVGELARSDKRDVESIDRVALKHIGKPLSALGLTREDIAEALAVDRNVERRDMQGGPAVPEVRRMITSRRRQLRTKRRRLRRLQNAPETVEQALLRTSEL